MKLSILITLISLLACNIGCKGNRVQESKMHKEEMVEKKPNHLIHEKSPYLQQHAYNPVNWYPWGKEAFEKAKREDKPVFLSIGYSTCHWCHVMERESFENGEIAGIMNEYFVSIKVDREERPDIDNVYMAAAQAMTGGGGWPLSIFMTPGKKPFYSGTYFPPHDVYGRMGFRSVLTVVARQWKTDKKNIVETGENIALSLGKFNELHSRSKGDSIKEDIFEQAFTARKNQFEPQYGGFSEGTKFPMGHGLSFLLRYYHRTGDSSALHMVTHTLDNMSAGGIYDHLGGGFHRYSTDRYWLAPHFEKMLYDQALLVLAYLEAFQVTGKERYARIVRETIEYVVRDMMHTEGGFYSAEDADSEGKEGKFYVWDREEILSLLGEKEGTLFCEFYGVEKEGNFEGHTILTAGEPEEQFAKRKDIPATQLSQQLKKNRELLFVHRSKRIRPHLDDKIMTDWNGLMISALSYASMVLNDSSYVEAAEKSAGFILRRLQRKDGRLLKHWRDSPASNLGLVEDYAFFINGLVDLYAATFDVKWLYEAKRLAGDFKRLFWDDNHGGFFLTPKDMEQLFTNPKELYDGAIPSGNSVGAYALIRLGHLLQDNQYTILAYDLFMAFSGQINKSPEAFPMLLIALDYAREIKKEVVIAGNRNNSDVREFLGKLYEQFQPGTVVILRESGENGKHIAGLVPFVKNQETVNGKSTFYVCKNYTCNLPTNNVEEAVRLIGE